MAELIAVILVYAMVARWVIADLIQVARKRRQKPAEAPTVTVVPEMPINAFNARAKEYK